MLKTLRIGLMPPLTGLVSLYGQEIVHAAQLACEEVNAQGGCGGFRLELRIEDDGSLPGPALQAAERLITQHGCAALVGNLLSSSRIAVAEQVEARWKIPYLNFSFYEGSIRGQYFFHFAALPNQQIDLMIPYMVRKYGPKVFFAGNNYEWPRGSIDAARRALAHCDGYAVGEEYLDLGIKQADVEGLLELLERSGADVLVPYFAGEDQLTLLNAFAARGLKDRMAVVMGHFDEAMAQMLEPHVRQGFYSSNTYFMTVDTPQNRRYLEHLAMLPGITGIWPKGNGLITNFGEATYLCVLADHQSGHRSGQWTHALGGGPAPFRRHRHACA